MRGCDGVRHSLTKLMGKMREDVAEEKRRFGEKVLPQQYVELLEKTSRPFAQAVTDAMAPERSFFGGKVLLVGEAAMGPRSAPFFPNLMERGFSLPMV